MNYISKNFVLSIIKKYLKSKIFFILENKLLKILAFFPCIPRMRYMAIHREREGIFMKNLQIMHIKIR